MASITDNLYYANSNSYIMNPYYNRKDTLSYIDPNISYGGYVPDYAGSTNVPLTKILGDGSRVIFRKNHWLEDYTEENNALYKYIIDLISARTNNEWWKSLSDADKIALLENYKSDEIKNFSNNAWGLAAGEDYTYDTPAIIEDLNALSELKFPEIQAPVYSDYVDSSEDIYKKVDAELNPLYTDAENNLNRSINQALANLSSESASMRDLYTGQLQENADLYNQRASGLLSNQYLANAQTYDALQSDMRKSRQNALEAGASAGLRLASNVNTLLSAQNKQSQISMDTSNSLAEMMLQQRQAASGIRSNYANYMMDANRQRTQLERERATGLSDLAFRRTDHRNSRYNSLVAEQNQDYTRANQAYTDAVTKFEDKASIIGSPLSSSYVAWARNNSYN